MKRPFLMNRRRLLQGIGVGAATLAMPFVRTLHGAAQEAGPPLRFVGIMTPCGTIGPAWGSRTSDTAFSFGNILSPFESLREQLLVLDGLDMSVTRLGPGGGHQRGAGAIFTGQHLLDGDFCGGNDCSSGTSGWAAGPSIDQALADHNMGTTRLRSLELGVRVRGSNNRHRIAYRAANDPLPPDDDPFQVYERLFAGAGIDRSELERQRRERASVLDLVRDDLGELSCRLGSEHRPRLDAHLESIREVERQLDATLAAGACTAPTLGMRFDSGNSDNYPLASRLQLDLLAAALACDATRSATVLFSGATSSQTFPWIDVSESHHALSHEGDGNADAQAKLTRINRWYAGEIARIASRLAEIPEGEGSVLDHTIIVWGNELAKGNTHSRNDMRLLLLGGAGAGLRLGRWLRFGDRPHNDLLVSVGRALGMDITRFGHRDHCTGPITELMA